MFVGEENGCAKLAYKPHPAQPLQLLAGEELKSVKKAKWEMWKRSGCLTHSDAAFWASRIACHEAHGPLIVTELVRRFPFLIVDELQDTGYFLGKAILKLLSAPTVQGFLVGDPDQSIFEFNGARPDLFDRFESISGAVRAPLQTSRRCPSAVASVAIHFKDSGGSLGSTGEAGRSLLIFGKEMTAEVHRLVDAIRRAKPEANIKVIARQNATVEALTGRKAKVIPKLHCLPLSHLSRAVVLFRQGNNGAALATARAALDLVIFGYEGVLDSTLEKAAIEPNRWRRLAVDCLLRANQPGITGSLHDFQTQIGAIVNEEMCRFDLPAPLKFTPGELKPQKRPGWDTSSSGYLPGTAAPFSILGKVPVSTVHGVKGETHDVTIFVCPPTADRYCPSGIWWSSAEKDREEKRIVYVAVTRPRELLIVWTSEDFYQRLQAKQPKFVASFECMTTDEFVQSLAPKGS